MMSREELRSRIVDADRKAAGHPWVIDKETREIIHAVAGLACSEDDVADRILLRMEHNALPDSTAVHGD